MLSNVDISKSPITQTYLNKNVSVVCTSTLLNSSYQKWMQVASQFRGYASRENYIYMVTFSGIMKVWPHFIQQKLRRE